MSENQLIGSVRVSQRLVTYEDVLSHPERHTIPDVLRAYGIWLRDEHDEELTAITERDYRRTSEHLRSHFERSPFWTEVSSSLLTVNERYRLQTQGYDLLGLPHTQTLAEEPFRPRIALKSYESFLLKTLRLNLINSASRRRSKPGNAILPSNWFNRINDVTRTTLYVKYLDGVPYLAEHIRNIASAHDLSTELTFQARDEGHYAAHLYVTDKVSLPTSRARSALVTAQLEVQISTQLKEVIGRLTHKHYENRRRRNPRGNSNAKWQWDYSSPEFSPNYLGHIVHYLEGVIVSLRNELSTQPDEPR
jgi:hypothetical protein